MYDWIKVTSVGTGEKMMVEVFNNDAGVPELGTRYGILRIEGETHLLVIDASDPDHPRFALKCREELVGIVLPDRAIQEDLDVWLGRVPCGKGVDGQGEQTKMS